VEQLSVAQARRVTLAAQGFGTPRPARVTARRLLGVVDRLGAIQIDSVNVLARAHYLPLFSRLGPYDRNLLDNATTRSPCHVAEYWAHEASLMRPDTHRLMRWRMRRCQEAGHWSGRGADQHPEAVAAVRDLVAEHGPVTASQVETLFAGEAPRARRDWWNNRSLPRRCLELLFHTGEITSAGRNLQFERRYASLATVLPAEMLAAADPTEPEAFNALVGMAARAYGVATERDLRDYFRLGAQETRDAIDSLVGAGELIPVEIVGARRPAWLHRDARVPRRVAARALLAPFDPLVWHRDRLEELFGFHYRIEIYVPAPQRRYGYYVLPFLLGDRIVARVDLKADRKGGQLLVRGAYAEPTAPPDTATQLAAELREMAEWLGLDRVTVEPVGDLAAALATSPV
jgi:uncharacterized protein YcaQ